ncbi:hypothetical protein [Variovorax sp. AFSI2.2]|uniref:hypothetical protein n=1 Tax=Variovorax sp. AFSI2.2 TaxID=3384160 RepID=UPI003EBCB0B7
MKPSVAARAHAPRINGTSTSQPPWRKMKNTETNAPTTTARRTQISAAMRRR